MNIEKLSASLSEKRYGIVETVDLAIEGVDSLVKEDLEVGLRRKLQVFIGKELEDPDPDMVIEVFNGVMMILGEKTYKITPIQILLARHAYFRVKVSEVVKGIPGRE